MTSDFAFCLRRWMTHKNIRAVDLAKQLGVHESAVSYWLSGSSGCSMKNLQRITEALGVSMEEFFSARGGKEDVA